MRRSILKEMGDGEEVSPQELSNRMALPLSNLAYHVRVLAECKAITLVRTLPVRGAVQHFYRFAIEAEWACKIVGLPPPATPGD
jgi:DNA-binding transcriptional ArsR family regulator